MKIAVCTGSFDPVTVGHMDIFRRAAGLFDMVYVAVLGNSSKKAAFTPDERCALINAAASAEGIANLRAEAYDGLAVDYARQKNACAIVRGIRNEADFAYETGMGLANRHLANEIETVYLYAEPGLSFISSSLVKELASYGKDIDGLVPDAIKNKIAERLIER